MQLQLTLWFGLQNSVLLVKNTTQYVTFQVSNLVILFILFSKCLFYMYSTWIKLRVTFTESHSYKNVYSELGNSTRFIHSGFSKLSLCNYSFKITFVVYMLIIHTYKLEINFSKPIVFFKNLSLRLIKIKVETFNSH